MSLSQTGEAPASPTSATNAEGSVANAECFDGSATQPAKASEFIGYQLWQDDDGALRVTAFQAGRMIELKPDPETAKQAPGFYDMNHQPVPDPV